jgi:hypothetical protein
MMRRVVLESPYAGKTQADIDANVAYARECLLDCLRRGESPLAGHLLYTQVLSEAKERRLGLNAHLRWIECADCLVVYTDRGISPGMQEAIEIAADEGTTPIEFRKLPKKRRGK